MVAIVQKPAPAFKTTAVVEGTFKDVALSDFLGQWCVLLVHYTNTVVPRGIYLVPLSPYWLLFLPCDAD